MDIYLQMEVIDGVCRFLYSLDGTSYESAGLPFTMKEGKWIGAKFGFAAE